MSYASIQTRVSLMIQDLTSRACLLTLLGFAVASGISDSVMGNPTGDDPSKPLKTHATVEEATALANTLYEIYNEEIIHVIRMHDNRSNPASFSDRQISKSAARLWKARRDAKHLELMSEPAGMDLSRKLFLLADQIDQFGLAYSRTPRGSQMMTKLITKLQRERPRFQKFLQQAAISLQKEGDPDVFTTQMEAKGMQMRETLVFFRPVEEQKHLLNFDKLLSQGDQRQSKLRRAEYLAKANEKIKAELTSATQSIAEIKRISREMADKGTAILADGKTVNGVEGFSKVADLWAQGSASLTRANATGWLMTNRSNDQRATDVSKLKNEALSALTIMISSLATNTPPDQIPAAYTGLLRKISLLDRRTAGQNQVVDACKPALEALAKKLPAFPDHIDSYTRATAEPLRWRRRYADQQAKNLSTQYVDAAVLLRSKAKVETSIRPNFVRSLNNETLLAASNFNHPADWMVHEAASRLVGKKVKENKLIRLGPTSRTGAVPYLNGHYANVAVSLPWEEALADLRTALVIDDKHQPLSMDAMEAISSGEMQDYASVGGTIQRVHLEALVTRFIAFPDLAVSLTPLGGLPLLTTDIPALEQTCWRLDISPNWGHNQYFTVRLGNSPDSTQTVQSAN